MAKTFYPLYHAVRNEEQEDWLGFRLLQVRTLCGQMCLDHSMTLLRYDKATDFYEAPYLVTYYDPEKAVSDPENLEYIKCPKCWAELPMVLLGDLP